MNVLKVFVNLHEFSDTILVQALRYILYFAFYFCIVRLVRECCLFVHLLFIVFVITSWLGL